MVSMRKRYTPWTMHKHNLVPRVQSEAPSKQAVEGREHLLPTTRRRDQGCSRLDPTASNAPSLGAPQGLSGVRGRAASRTPSRAGSMLRETHGHLRHVVEPWHSLAQVPDEP